MERIHDLRTFRPGMFGLPYGWPLPISGAAGPPPPPVPELLFADAFAQIGTTWISARTPDVDVVGGGWVEVNRWAQVNRWEVRGAPNDYVRQNPAGGNVWCTVVGDVDTPEVMIQADITKWTGGWRGIAFRVLDEANRWHFSVSGNVAYLRKKEANVETTVLSTPHTWANFATKSMRVWLAGNSIMCEIDDIPIFNTVHAFNNTEELHALYGEADANTHYHNVEIWSNPNGQCEPWLICDLFDGAGALTDHTPNKGGSWTERGSSGNSGTLVGGACRQTADGTNDFYATLGVNVPVGIGETGTIEATVATIGGGATYTTPGLLFLADVAAGDGLAVWLEKSAKSSNIVSGVVTAWDVVAAQSDPVPALNLGTNYRLKVIWDSTGSAIMKYLDDVLIATDDQSAAGPFADDFVGLAFPDRGLAQGTGRWDQIFGKPNT